MKLNRGQTEAVCHRDGPCMVLSGPGSGKTTVITNRVLGLSNSPGIDPETILVITFTRAAAEEMEKRYLALAGKQREKPVFGTFHSVFFQILKTEYGLKTESVAGDEERVRILRDAVRASSPGVTVDGDLLSSLFSAFSAIKNASKSRKDTDLKVDCQAVYREYMKRMREERLIDFDDMMVYTYRLFKTRPESLTFWRGRFRYFLIDEFQDINPMQYAIVKLLAAPRNNLFIVGDDDQSIYGFRGASPKLMLSFPKDYPEAKTVCLTENYRSSPEIVNASLSLIRRNTARFEKRLSAAVSECGSVQYRLFPTEEEETEAIADTIERELKCGVKASGIAVLFRTKNGTSALVGKLMAKKIAFFLRDEPINLFSHFVAGPLFGCLNFVNRGGKRSDFLLFMNCPYRGFSRGDLPDETVDLRAVIESMRRDESRRFRSSKAEFFFHQLLILKKLGTPFAMINYFRIGLGYDAYLPVLAKKKRVDEDELRRILDEIQASSRPYRTVEEWYRYIESYGASLKENGAKRANEDAVQISTIHASKGLEFHTVFLPDLNEKIMPHEKASGEEEIEEERRLLYVGMTRASRRLCLSSVERRFGKEMEPSRFLGEIR